jgi:FAS-associated factor 2
LERKKNLKENLIPEPDSATTELVTKMNIRLTSGTRLIRTFDAMAPIQQLYDFVEIHDLEPIDLLSDFVIVNTYPRREFHEKTITFQDAGLFPNATVLVEEVDPLVHS